MNIIEIAVKRPVFVIMMVASIVVLGIIGYSNLAVDLLPNVEFPNIGVTSIYPGASAEEMENLFSKPLENTLGTVEGLDTLYSISREGVSIVVISFNMGTDIKASETKVREKVQFVKRDLPQDANEPLVQRFSTEDTPIINLSLSGSKNLTELRDILEDTVRPRIETLPGVGSISVSGARKDVIRIIVSKMLLAANGINYNQITAAIQRKNVSYPIGSVREDARNITVRVDGKVESVEEIGNLTLTSFTGKLLRIRDIASVEPGLEEERTRARVNGETAVIFSVYKQSGANTVRISDSVRARIEEIEKTLPYGVDLRVIDDTSSIIKRNVRGVQDDIFLGIGLAIVIVWLFLGNFRSTMITAVALPNSILGAFFLINLFGFSINTITLLAISLAVGLLIDDSIVVRENIFRHIELGQDPRSAALAGTKEVFLPVLSTTLSIMAVFIPISFLSGLVGKFLKEFGLTVAFALLISLLDAYTTAPMLSAYWFKKTETRRRKGIGRIVEKLTAAWNRFYDRLNNAYKNILVWSLEHKKAVLSSIFALMLLSVSTVFFMGKIFLAPIDTGVFNISVEMYPGAPLDRIDAVMKDIEKHLESVGEVDSYYATAGANGSHSGSINVELVEMGKRSRSTKAVIEDIRAYIKAKHDAALSFSLNEKTTIDYILGSSGGTTADIVINVSGPDLGELETLTRAVLKVVSATAGTAEAGTSIKSGTPELVLEVDDVRAEKEGVSAAEIGLALRDLVQGGRVSTFSAGGKDFDIYIELDKSHLGTRDAVRNLVVTSRTGRKVPLSAICTFREASAPPEIRREKKERVARVYAKLVNGYSLADVVANIGKSIDRKVVFPPNYTYAFSGQQKYFEDMQKQMIFAILLSVVFMYMILASLYNSFLQPLMIMISLPLAVIGSFLLLTITGVDLDMYGYIGLLMVLGLVAKNAILLLDFTNKKREEGMSIREALVTAGPIRLRPILMTSFAIVFGMLPLALGLNEGSTGRQALPMTVIGGILTSTFLTLVVVPLVYEWVEGFLEKRRKKKAA